MQLQTATSPRRIYGDFEAIEPLAEGSMGVLLLAKHRMYGYKVAVKRLRDEYADEPELTARLFDEARAAESVRHPGMVHYLDTGHDQVGRPFVVMELLEGESLEERLLRGPLPMHDSVRIARQVAETLVAAHRASIIHRDLKPDNIYLTKDPLGRFRVKVLDFGVAKFVGDSRTQVGNVFGTPLYMSPEQCRGAINATPRSDVYGLGCVLYRLITGRTPFAGNLQEVLFAQMELDPIAPRSINSTTPRPLEELVLAMMSKNPDDRPTMEQVEKRLASIARKVRPRRRRNRARRWALAAALMVMLGAAGASLGFASVDNTRDTPAQR